MAKKRKDDIDVLMEIRDKVIRIDTHLSDMNGKIMKHDEMLTQDFPAKCLEYTMEISKLKTQMKAVMFVSGALTIAIITHAFTMVR
jgi:hypothetical protein